MKPYYLFYLLSAFSFGGSFVFLTLGGYTPQVITMDSLGVVSILVGLLFRKYTK